MLEFVIGKTAKVNQTVIKAETIRVIVILLLETEPGCKPAVQGVHMQRMM